MDFPLIFFYLRIFQCLIQIFDNIVHVFNTNGKADHSRRNSCLNQLFIVHLAVCMAGRVKNHGNGSSNVRGDDWQASDCP